MKKIMIIGCPGAGKSSLARELHARTGLPLYHLDMIWHKPDRTTVTREEFDARLAEILARDAWIIDGNYSRTIDVRLAACDTVFLLDLPVEDCLAGAESRIGTQRPDLPWLEETLDEEFRQWILDFPRENLPRIYRLLEPYRARVQVVILRSHEEIDTYLKNMKSET